MIIVLLNCDIEIKILSASQNGQKDELMRSTPMAHVARSTQRLITHVIVCYDYSHTF